MTNAECLTQINAIIDGMIPEPNTASTPKDVLAFIFRRDTIMQINRIIKELCVDCFAEGVIKGKEITLRDQKLDRAQRRVERLRKAETVMKKKKHAPLPASELEACRNWICRTRSSQQNIRAK